MFLVDVVDSVSLGEALVEAYVVSRIQVVNSGSVVDVRSKVEPVPCVGVDDSFSFCDKLVLVDVVSWINVDDSGSVVKVKSKVEAVSCVGVGKFY